MSTTVVRRLYVYAAAFLGLQVFATGLSQLIASCLSQRFQAVPLASLSHSS